MGGRKEERDVPVAERDEGFSHFVTSMTAPIASGWNGCRVGLAPTGKRRLVTAHTHSGHRTVIKKTFLVALSAPVAASVLACFDPDLN
jgi:hypothetical protein